MKKLLLTTAVAALAATPAFAGEGVKLSVGGHAKVYLGYINSDEAAGVDERSIDIYSEKEIHLSGETTLDNGLTVGAHFELDADENDDSNVEESYIYMSGDWGRVNVGAEDGVAYLLQVAAPSADSNVDGLRQYIQGDFSATRLDYDQATTGKDEKISYLSPVFGGAQLGLTYVPEVGGADAAIGTTNQEDNDISEEAYEVALRYEGAFEEVGFTVGAGFTHVEEGTGAAGLGDQGVWNVGADLDFGPFGLGVVYMEDDQENTGSDQEVETFVIGADYTTGAFKLGASYFNQDDEGTDIEHDRYTGGVVYTYGPGMTFRGSVSFQEEDTAAADNDTTAVMLGTQINF